MGAKSKSRPDDESPDEPAREPVQQPKPSPRPVGEAELREALPTPRQRRPK